MLQVKRLIWRLTSERIVRSLYLFACVYCAVKHCIYNLWGGMRLLILWCENATLYTTNIFYNQFPVEQFWPMSLTTVGSGDTSQKWWGFSTQNSKVHFFFLNNLNQQVKTENLKCSKNRSAAWSACFDLLAISKFKVLAKMQSGAMSLSSSRADHVHAESHYVNTNKVLNGAIRWRRPHVNRMRGSEDISSSKALWSGLVLSCRVGSGRAAHVG